VSQARANIFCNGFQELALALDAAHDGLADPTAPSVMVRAVVEDAQKEVARQRAISRTLFAELRSRETAHETAEAEAARRTELDRTTLLCGRSHIHFLLGRVSRPYNPRQE
jgi:hypothetical protein